MIHVRTFSPRRQQGNGSTGGSILAASINAACLALLDGGLPMTSMFAAVSCACLVKEDQVGDHEEDALELIVDPTDEQETSANAVLTFAFESAEKKLVASHFSGTTSGHGAGGRGMKGGVLSEKKLQECLCLCAQATDEIFQFYRDCVRQKMTIDSPGEAKEKMVTVSRPVGGTTKA